MRTTTSADGSTIAYDITGSGSGSGGQDHGIPAEATAAAMREFLA